MRDQTEKFHGRRALITGSARRVGRAIAVHLAKSGADIIIHYHRSEDEARSLAEEITRIGREAQLWRCDLSQSATLESNVDKVFDELPQFDILINNASPNFVPIDLSHVDSQVWREYLAVHLLSPFFLARAFSQKLSKERGDVINILDTRADQPKVGFLPYSVSKVALEQLTKNLALELAPRVRVNAVAPGYVLAPESVEVSKVDLERAVFLKRRGEPQDIAEAVEYLLSAKYVVGETINVDGGRG